MWDNTLNYQDVSYQNVQKIQLQEETASGERAVALALANASCG